MSPFGKLVKFPFNVVTITVFTVQLPHIGLERQREMIAWQEKGPSATLFPVSLPLHPCNRAGSIVQHKDSLGKVWKKRPLRSCLRLVREPAGLWLPAR